jgi:SDA1
VIKAIAFNFVTERCTGDVMAVGINVIKEVIKRVPAVLDEPGMDAFVQDICAYSRNRDKSVVVAARGFTNLIREIYPSLLRGRDRGKHHDITAKPAAYGAENVLEGVEGAELLTLADAGIITMDSSSDSDNDDSDNRDSDNDNDDEWQDVNSDNDEIDIPDIDDSTAVDSTTANDDNDDTMLAAAAEHDGWEECSSENDEEENSEEDSEQGDGADSNAENSDDDNDSDGMEVEEDSAVEDSETETTATTVKSSSSRVMFADSVKSHDGSNDVTAVVTSSTQSSTAVVQKKADDGMEIDLRSIQVIQSKRADATRILTAEVRFITLLHHYNVLVVASLQQFLHYKHYIAAAVHRCALCYNVSYVVVLWLCRYC